MRFLLYLGNSVSVVFKYAQFDSLIHLLNIASAIPFIASLGIHFYSFQHLQIKKHHCQWRERLHGSTIWRQTYLNLWKFKAGVQSKIQQHPVQLLYQKQMKVSQLARRRPPGQTGDTGGNTLTTLQRRWRRQDVRGHTGMSRAAKQRERGMATLKKRRKNYIHLRATQANAL